MFCVFTLKLSEEKAQATTSLRYSSKSASLPIMGYFLFIFKNCVLKHIFKGNTVEVLQKKKQHK